MDNQLLVEIVIYSADVKRIELDSKSVYMRWNDSINFQLNAIKEIMSDAYNALTFYERGNINYIGDKLRLAKDISNFMIYHNSVFFFFGMSSPLKKCSELDYNDLRNNGKFSYLLTIEINVTNPNERYNARLTWEKKNENNIDNMMTLFPWTEPPPTFDNIMFGTEKDITDPSKSEEFNSGDYYKKRLLFPDLFFSDDDYITTLKKLTV